MDVAHELVYEIYKVSPAVLISVVPVLEQELKVDDIPSRLLATRVTGKMLSEKNSNLSKDFPILWKLWLDRSMDSQPTVRLERVALSASFYENQPALWEDINKSLLERLQDPDDRVRVACCTLFNQFTKATMLDNVSTAIFKGIQERTRDRQVI